MCTNLSRHLHYHSISNIYNFCLKKIELDLCFSIGTCLDINVELIEYLYFASSTIPCHVCSSQIATISFQTPVLPAV